MHSERHTSIKTREHWVLQDQCHTSFRTMDNCVTQHQCHASVRALNNRVTQHQCHTSARARSNCVTQHHCQNNGQLRHTTSASFTGAIQCFRPQLFPAVFVGPDGERSGPGGTSLYSKSGDRSLQCCCCIMIDRHCTMGRL